MNISVIIPVRNEQGSIDELLSRLLAQTLPPNEIVITDGGSVDNTCGIIQDYIDQGAPIRLIRTNKALPGRGRNLAVLNSRGEWLAFTDGGIKPEPNWLACLAERAEAMNADVIYGAWEPHIDSFFRECAAIAYVTPPAQHDGQYQRPPFIASSLVRRSVWQQVGGFPEDLRSAEDLLFMKRIGETHAKIAFSAQALVRWEIQSSLGRTFKRFATYARNNIRAGLWRNWQAAIFRQYALLILAAMPAVYLGFKWLIIWSGLWLLLLLARSCKAIWQNRHVYPASLVRHGLRLLLIMPIILTLDAAAFVGSINWLFMDRLGFAISREENAPHE